MKRHKSGSTFHRTAFSAQTDYLEEVEELFPWVLEEEGGASEAKEAGPSAGDNGSGKAIKEGSGVKVEGSKSDNGKVLPMKLEWCV